MGNRDIIKAALLTPAFHGRWGLPLLFEGEPGTGKSSQIAAIGKELGLHVEVLMPSIKDPTDISGLPVVNKSGSVNLASPGWAQRLCEAGSGLLFADELTTCAPAVQAALLGVVLEGVVGDTRLPPGVRIISASNSVDDAANGQSLAPPLANRFGHMAWGSPNVDAWSEYMLSLSSGSDSKGPVTNLEKEEARVMELWPAAFAKAVAYTTSFLTKRPELLHAKPSCDDPQSSKAWPSSRTWEFASRALASSYVHKLSAADTHNLISGFVGVGPTSEFLRWMTSAELPDPAKLLKGEVDWNVAETRSDITHAVLQSITYTYLSDEKVYSPYIENLIDIFCKVADSGTTSDVLIRPIRRLNKAGVIKPGDHKSKRREKILELFEALGDFADAAKL